MTRAFLIGAGATRAEYHNAPLNADFFKLLPKQDKEGKRLFLKIKNTIQPYLDQPLIESNVEDVMIKSYQFPPSIKISFMESLYSAIYYLLAEPTESDSSSMNRYIHTPRTPPTLFKTLINDNRLNEEDFFITLNYDLYLDRELLSIQDNKIDYGISEEFLNEWRKIDILSEPKFSVYHLHGSLNWGIFEGKLSIDQGAIKPKYTRYGIDLCLIPPGKKELDPVLKSIWSIAEERLLKADELIVIGCSLNPKDTELINLVKKFVNERGPENIKIIYKEDSLDNWKIYTEDLLDNWKNDRPWPIQKDSKYERYLRVTREQFKAYPYGFVLPGPPNNPRYGAIEFIFDKSE